MFEMFLTSFFLSIVTLCSMHLFHIYNKVVLRTNNHRTNKAVFFFVLIERQMLSKRGRRPIIKFRLDNMFYD